MEGETEREEVKMKRMLTLSIVVLLSVLAANVQAANLSFNPDAVELAVSPGAHAIATIEAKLDAAGFCAVDMEIDLTDSQGNLPHGWFPPARVRLGTRTGVASAPVALKVNVPADAPAGKYSARVKPRIARATESVESDDIILVVQVLADNKCDGSLAFENVKVGPENIWAPTDKEVMIELSGNIVVSLGCEVKGVYSMESNNGPVAGNLDIEDGSFVRQFPVMVSKTGKDKEGTAYQGTLSIEDEAGNKAIQGFLVTVDHDRGKDGERNPKNK